MKSRYLLPHRFKWIGIALSVLFLALGFAVHQYEFQLPLELPIRTKGLFTDLSSNNMTDELAVVGLIAGLLFAAFSREKVEDEFIAQLRLESLQWAVYIHYILLALAYLLVYGLPAVHILMYNMFVLPIIFIVRFNFLLYRYNQTPEGPAA